MTSTQAQQLQAIYDNLGNIVIEKCNYILDLNIIHCGTDTSSTFIQLEFNYSNITGYNRLYRPYETAGYSGPLGDVIGYKKDGTSIIITGSTTEGIYDISNYNRIQFKYTVRARSVDMNTVMLMPYLFSE